MKNRISDLLTNSSNIEISRSHEKLIPEKYLIKKIGVEKYIDSICEESNIVLLTSNSNTAMEFSNTDVEPMLKYLGKSYEKQICIK